MLCSYKQEGVFHPTSPAARVRDLHKGGKAHNLTALPLDSLSHFGARLIPGSVAFKLLFSSRHCFISSVQSLRLEVVQSVNQAVLSNCGYALTLNAEAPSGKVLKEIRDKESHAHGSSKSCQISHEG